MLTLRDDRQIRSLTGLSEEKLEEIGPAFAQTLKDDEQQRYEKALAEGKRHRKLGGGRNSKLTTPHIKLCFILYYLKLYPTFDVLAEKFDLSRSNAHNWVHSLTPLVAKTLSNLGYMPARKFNSIEDFKAACEGLDEILIDVTEREFRRPKDNEVQKEVYSGKQGYHTQKNTVMSSKEKIVLFVGQTFGGRNHDYTMLKEEFSPKKQWFEDIKVAVDLGYQGIKKDYEGIGVAIPHKKARKSKANPNPKLSKEQKAHNQAVSKIRVYVENAIGGMKRFKVLVHAFRNRIEGFVDDVIGVGAGLWNCLIA